MIVITKAKNYHLINNVPDEDIDREIGFNNKKYRISINGLFIKTSYNPFVWIWKKLFRIKNRFVIIFVEGRKEPIGLIKSENVSGQLLYKVTYSSALNRAIRELFGLHIGGKKVIFIIGVVIFLVVIGVFVYPMIQTGRLRI